MHRLSKPFLLLCDITKILRYNPFIGVACVNGKIKLHITRDPKLLCFQEYVSGYEFVVCRCSELSCFSYQTVESVKSAVKI